MKRCLNKIISFLLCLLLLLPAPKITISADNRIENNQNKERVMIELGDHSKEEVIAFIRNNEKNASIKHEFDELFNGFSIDLNASTILKLKLSGLVKKVHKTNLYYPLMTSSAAITFSDKALNQFNDGSGLVISIIDSGIDTSHQDLSFLPKPELAKIKEIKQSSQTTYSIKIPYGKNFVDGNDIVKDSTSSMHGIHVAGIAGA